MRLKFQLTTDGNSNQLNFTGAINILQSIFKAKEEFCLSPRIVNQNLLGFAFRELT